MPILVSSIIVYTLAASVVGSNVTILGLRPADRTVTVADNGALHVEAGKKVALIVFGNGIINSTKVSFSDDRHADSSCVRKRESLPREPGGITDSGWFVITEFFEKADSWFLCIDDAKGNLWPIDSEYAKIEVIENAKPGWQIGFQITAICILLVLSGLFSGLNLGLMALNPDELQVVKNVGSETERKYAAKILPLRRHGNFLLCTLLLGNVIVNTTATILLDELTGSGFVAVFSSAAGIVVFGEIVPQSVCTRHGLAVGAKTIWLTKFFMIITAFIAWPLSKLLDCLFGEEIGQRNNRDKFIEMAKLSQQKGDEHFDPNTVAIIDGAFQLKEKVVKDVMTPIEKVFMIDYNERLTFDLISKISEKGFTRIPVYKKEDNTRNIVGIIFVKDLIFIDPADNMPIKAICDHTNHQLMFTYEEITLDHILAEFKTGSSHMAIVQRPVSVPGKDPYYEITGVVTLEDVIEEMIGSEIIDETDYFVDNTGRHRANRHRKMDFKAFLHQPKSTVFPPQLKLACFQYLHSEIEAFEPSKVHSSVLKKLMECNVLFEIKLDTAVNDGSHVLYRKNVPSEYFILILEGRATVSVGKDNLTFEAGPFHYFGEAVLSPNPSNRNSPAREFLPTVGSKVLPPSAAHARLGIGGALPHHLDNVNFRKGSLTVISNLLSSSNQNQQSATAHQLSSFPRHALVSRATSTSGNMQFNGGGTGNTTEEDCGNRGTGGGAGGVGKLRANSIMTQESSFSASKMSVQSHKESVFMPDFTVTATSNLVIFKIKQKHYMAAVKTSQLIYEQQSAEKSDTLLSSPDDDSKANELKEMENVEKLLSDELSKVDAQERGLSAIGGTPRNRPTSERAGSVESISEERSSRMSGGRKTETSPTSVWFKDSSVAENGRIKTGDDKSSKSKSKDETSADKGEEQPLLSAPSGRDEMNVSVDDEDDGSKNSTVKT